MFQEKSQSFAKINNKKVIEGKIRYLEGKKNKK